MPQSLSEKWETSPASMIFDMVLTRRWEALAGSEGLRRWDGFTGGKTKSPLRCFNIRFISHCAISVEVELAVGDPIGRGKRASRDSRCICRGMSAVLDSLFPFM